MSSPSYDVLVAVHPGAYRQQLIDTIHRAWPNTAITLAASAGSLRELLARQYYAAILAEESYLDTSPARLLASLRYQCRRTRLILLTAHEGAKTGTQAPPGADYYQVSGQAVAEVVIAALSSWLATSLPKHAALPAPAPLSPFSRRELEVLRLVVADRSNQEIADRLCLSVRTVESHRRALLQKAGTKTIVGLAVQAVMEGWVQSVETANAT
ncbi:helix-turn-helix transcriptional regulator [Hymenobacter latericus]|uniref:helix-turn-helix transcriptional regulator n=1 Tax=Hymenobacter sp. YIM 151858-1 TaxID=2987688 RepID=UPI002227FC62|nr:LuxR C-terminal-related transcriptional regulator [Hymenobacter sp. YIM 151858-1]UYZ57580.1 LuxR C-terminal-related transcriptional regulator [Hymenobacter sp. YIM 151858-1]